jgi:hypothetical protein
MRKLFGVGKPRVLQGAGLRLVGVVLWLYGLTTSSAGGKREGWGLLIAGWLARFVRAKYLQSSTVCYPIVRMNSSCRLPAELLSPSAVTRCWFAFSGQPVNGH